MNREGRYEILTLLAIIASVAGLALTVAGRWQASSLGWNIAAALLWLRAFACKMP